jgi:hypothetical protein
MTAHRKVLARQLTTCDVIKDGQAVRLDLINEAGHAVSVEMSVEQAHSVVMTLPHLLSVALKTRTGNEQTRYVFPLNQWSLESTSEAKCHIVTLTAVGGFEVAFGVPFAECCAIGWALCQEGKAAIDRDDEAPEPATSLPSLN